MKVADFINYLLKRSAAILKNGSKKLTDDDLDFVYSDADCEKRKLHLLNNVVYMIDYDIIKMLPELYEDLVSSLKIPEYLPGGLKCMMNAVRHRMYIQHSSYTSDPLVNILVSSDLKQGPHRVLEAS